MARIETWGNRECRQCVGSCHNVWRPKLACPLAADLAMLWVLGLPRNKTFNAITERWHHWPIGFNSISENRSRMTLSAWVNSSATASSPSGAKAPAQLGGMALYGCFLLATRCWNIIASLNTSCLSDISSMSPICTLFAGGLHWDSPEYEDVENLSTIDDRNTSFDLVWRCVKNILHNSCCLYSLWGFHEFPDISWSLIFQVLKTTCSTTPPQMQPTSWVHCKASKDASKHWSIH